ncbi:MAG: thiamine-phosphate kinase [Candidatus Sumerlaeaceae bacterium]|nr:thiamine-phosphate kinase [Candidatus Sumerlaeaceae bacterium]
MSQSGETTVADIGERALIAALAPYVAASAGDVVVGIGDDAAVIAREPDGVWHDVVTTDMLAAGTHFLANSDTDWRRLGHKAVAANISDLAAMGARPRYLLVSLAVPQTQTVTSLLSLYEGMREEAMRWGAVLVGGDTVRLSALTISITAVGSVPAGRAIPLRSNAKPGQNVYVSGHLGSSAAGLLILTGAPLVNPCADSVRLRLLERHLKPEPRPLLGQILTAVCPDLAMVDISDSLYNEMHMLAQASGIGFEIESDRIPVCEELREYCRCADRDPVELALFSGEEYELLFCTAASPDALASALAAAGSSVPVSLIGRVTDAAGTVVLRSASGQIWTPPDQTFRHFS